MLNSSLDLPFLEIGSTSTHSTLLNGFVSAIFNTSSTVFTGMTSIDSKIVLGTSIKSFCFLLY